ncbi:MAG TPA: spondin domain-containing protein [Gammaproteobacteria bacterium]
MRTTTSLFVGILLSTSMLTAANSWAGDGETYKITIINLTPGQPLAPVMAASHRSGMSFFEAGQPPSDELAMLAEAGNGNPMAAKLLATPGVSDAQVSTMGLTFPGKTTTLVISAKRGTDNVSIGAMLGATNDAFFAVTDVALPKGRQTVTYMADAYDAGSETNDELASTVAGLGGEGYSPNDSGEGFVHIHNGIHGVGDANAALLDWRNPVAEIIIERMK